MKSSVTALILLSLLALTLGQNAKSFLNSVEKLPYIIFIEGLLEGQWSFLCGGALISEQHVVTAASCVDFLPPSDLRIIAGTSTLDGQGVSAGVLDGFVPTNYDPSILDNDLILLKLATKLPLSKTVKPIQLCSTEPSEEDTLMLSGWGKPNEDIDSKLSNQVHSIVGNVINHWECEEAYSSDEWAVVTDNMFCMKYDTGYDTCTGDGGGPAVRNNELCGILSWQKNCNGTFPGVYTSVYRQLEFLKDAMTA